MPLLLLHFGGKCDKIKAGEKSLRLFYRAIPKESDFLDYREIMRSIENDEFSAKNLA